MESHKLSYDFCMNAMVQTHTYTHKAINDKYDKNGKTSDYEKNKLMEPVGCPLVKPKNTLTAERMRDFQDDNLEQEGVAI